MTAVDLPTRPERPPVWAMLLWVGGPTAVLVAAALLSVGQGRDVIFPWVQRVIPETCAMHSRFGVDCPGCGLTRSFIHIMHGRPLDALFLNPASWLLFGYVAIQIPIAAATWRLPHVSPKIAMRIHHIVQWNQGVLIGLMVVLMAQWVIRLAAGAAF